MKCSEIKVVKKDGTKEEFNVQKVLAAVNKSANRAMINFSKAESKFICEFVEEKAEDLDEAEVPIAQMLWSASTRWSRRATAITATISRISSRCSMKSTKRASPSCTSATRRTAIRTVLSSPRSAA